jgi:hypothetical protein
LDYLLLHFLDTRPHRMIALLMAFGVASLRTTAEIDIEALIA